MKSLGLQGSRWKRLAMRSVALSLMILPALGSAQQNSPQQSLSIDDRSRLMKEFNNCWQTRKSQRTHGSASGGGSADGSSDEQATTLVNMMIKGRIALGGRFDISKEVQKELPITTDAVALEIIKYCYSLALGGVVQSTPTSTTAGPPASTPPPQTKINRILQPKQSLPPIWVCHEPAVFLSASCDKGSLGSDAEAGTVMQNEGLVQGWQQEEKVYSTVCKHPIASQGSVKTRSSCTAKNDGAIKLTLANRLEGQGGCASNRKDCPEAEHRLTSLALRIDEGGAEVRIPAEAAGLYDLQVDSFDCTTLPKDAADGAVELQATFLGTRIPLEVRKRFQLDQAGLVELRLRGNAKFKLGYGKEVFSLRTGCDVSLSLQPHKNGVARITALAPTP